MVLSKQNGSQSVSLDLVESTDSDARRTEVVEKTPLMTAADRSSSKTATKDVEAEKTEKVEKGEKAEKYEKGASKSESASQVAKKSREEGGGEVIL